MKKAFSRNPFKSRKSIECSLFCCREKVDKRGSFDARLKSMKVFTTIETNYSSWRHAYLMSSLSAWVDLKTMQGSLRNKNTRATFLDKTRKDLKIDRIPRKQVPFSKTKQDNGNDTLSDVTWASDVTQSHEIWFEETNKQRTLNSSSIPFKNTIKVMKVRCHDYLSCFSERDCIPCHVLSHGMPCKANNGEYRL